MSLKQLLHRKLVINKTMLALFAYTIINLELHNLLHFI